MTPAICKLCNKEFGFALSYALGGLVCFSNYEDLPEGMVGKAQGCDWYCVDHYQEALSKAHLPSEQAYLALKAEFPNVVMHDWRERFDPELWITDIGLNKAKVILYIRMIRQLNPIQLKQKLSQAEFKVIHGWPTQINPHKEKLEVLGATVEIRFP